MREYKLIEGNHRYKLLYEWDSTLPKVFFIMLNPTRRLNPNEPGPTSKKIIEWAKAAGYGGVWIGNLFSLISSNPYSASNLDSKKNDVALREMFLDSSTTIFAWGAFRFAYDRALEIRRMFPSGRYLFRNRDGSPAHPLSKNFK